MLTGSLTIESRTLLNPETQTLPPHESSKVLPVLRRAVPARSDCDHFCQWRSDYGKC